MNSTPSHARYAVILTHNRPDLLAQSAAAIAPQVDLVLVVDNASDPPATVDAGLNNVLFIYDDGQPPNLARLWNLALNAVEKRLPDGVDTWDVAVLCDDATVPAGWVDTVSTCMRVHNAAAASTHAIHPLTTPMIKTVPDSDIANRMCGWAFILAGEKGLRADESMHWWWQDSDLDRQARLAGGMVIAVGPVVSNEKANDFTYSVPGLAERAGLDREAFRVKWGDVPW